MPHKEKSALADREIPAINYFFRYIDAVLVFEIHQIRLPVPNFIKRRSLLRFTENVGKLRVVVDRFDVKGFLIWIETVGKSSFREELLDQRVLLGLSCL